MACADCATCLAVLPDDNASPSFVKVADVAGHRLLFFSDNDDCTSATAAPAEWQTRAAMDGGSDEIAESYFPPDEDYIALFVIALALLPAAVLAHGFQEFGKNTASTTTRLLILGGGGGVLESLYSRLLPSAIVDVVEPSQAVRMLGHRYFGAKAEFHHMQARRFVRGYRGPKYDLVALDAFENDGEESATPRAWSRREWCSELSAILHPAHGILAANLYAADETSAPFRAHCDQLLLQRRGGSMGGSRVVLAPGRRRSTIDGEAAATAQTVEVWSPFGNLSAYHLQRAATALGQHHPATVTVLGSRVPSAWNGQVSLGRDGQAASMPPFRGAGLRDLAPHGSGSPLANAVCKVAAAVVATLALALACRGSCDGRRTSPRRLPLALLLALLLACSLLAMTSVSI